MVLNGLWQTIGGVICFHISDFFSHWVSEVEVNICEPQTKQTRKRSYILHLRCSIQTESKRSKPTMSCSLAALKFQFAHTYLVQHQSYCNRDSGDRKLNVTAPLSVTYLCFIGGNKIHSLVNSQNEFMIIWHGEVRACMVLQSQDNCENEKGKDWSWKTGLYRVRFQQVMTIIEAPLWNPAPPGT